MAIQPTSISPTNMQQFLTKATSIAWSLVTAVPPLIPSCDEHTFRDDLHEKSPTSWDEKRSTNYRLKYIWPVLFTNSFGAVAQKGCVRNAKLDEGKMTNLLTLTCMNYKYIGLFDSTQLQSLQVQKMYSLY